MRAVGAFRRPTGTSGEGQHLVPGGRGGRRAADLSGVANSRSSPDGAAVGASSRFRPGGLLAPIGGGFSGGPSAVLREDPDGGRRVALDELPEPGVTGGASGGAG